MRYSHYYVPTLKETPADAEIVSHQLMLRAGMIRKVAAGIYNYLPFGLRSIRKMEQIIREEMDRAGAIELLMPSVTPAELWQESGRWQVYGKELLRFKDRKDTGFCLGPTHEEVITDIVRKEVRSYRQLPLNLYQVQAKFRDEVRPRFGLMRGREFIMKDAYSFDADDAGADASYEKMYQAYRRIFERCGLNFRAVEADSGAIGGTSSHEFMVLADSGEDAIVSCNQCEYAANVEKAEIVLSAADAPPATQPMERAPTPGQKTIAEVCAFLDLPQEKSIKSLILETDEGDFVMAVLRGDHELNTVKLAHVLGCNEVFLADDAQIKELTGAPAGYLGPVGTKLRVVADNAVKSMADMCCGANEVDMHYIGVNLGRDFKVTTYADLREAVAGDPCPRCNGTLESWRGIEVGHVFKLGTKYSEAMGATVQDADGKEVVLVMGCYGIGVGRTVAAAIEQNHDENGIIFPMPLAPFQVIVTMMNPKDDAVREAAEEVYRDLLAAGIEVLLDDRDERAGIKFKDAELLGIPLRLTVGARSLAEGNFELQQRATQERSMVPVASAVSMLSDAVKKGLDV